MDIKKIDKIFKNDVLSIDKKGYMYLDLLKSNNYQELIIYIEKKYNYEIFKFLKEKKNFIFACKSQNLKCLIYDQDLILLKYNELKNKMSKDLLDIVMIALIPHIASKL